MKLTDIITEYGPDTMWEIVDKNTSQRVGKPSNNKRRLRSRADKLDNEYGAVRYIVKPIIEQVHPLANQHDLRKRAIGMINAARNAHKKAGGDGVIAPAEIIGFVKKNFPNAKREELEAIRTLLT